ncbi:hypothetical protein ACA910_001064 [Epithemia clementina (nom. ined.)]
MKEDSSSSSSGTATVVPLSPHAHSPMSANSDDVNSNNDKKDNNNMLSTSSVYVEEKQLSGGFRGIAVAARKFLMAGKRTLTAHVPTIKTTIRQIGQIRPLAFASEGAVAGASVLPTSIYYGAWGMSGLAIVSDIYTKQDDATAYNKSWETTIYWTAFHIPASLVVPAYIIHQIVHKVQHAVENPHGFAKTWSPRARAWTPVGAALLSIIPVVPVVDTTFEYILEPTLGAHLGLEFHGHHGHNANHEHQDSKEKKEN